MSNIYLSYNIFIKWPESLNFLSKLKVNSSGACFDWFLVSCEPHEKKEKKREKKSFLEYH